MIPPSGSGRSAPLPAKSVALRKDLRTLQIPESLTSLARCGAERPHREGAMKAPLLGLAATMVGCPASGARCRTVKIVSVLRASGGGGILHSTPSDPMPAESPSPIQPPVSFSREATGRWPVKKACRPRFGMSQPQHAPLAARLLRWRFRNRRGGRYRCTASRSAEHFLAHLYSETLHLELLLEGIPERIHLIRVQGLRCSL